MNRDNQKAIEINGVWVSYDSHVVLRNIDLSLESNAMLGIIGPNGGGKTTLLKVILGLIKPDRGAVKIFGQSAHRSRSMIGYAPQKSLTNHDFPVNVFDVVLMGRLSKRGLFRNFSSEDVACAEKALQSVEMLDLKKRQIGELSEGQRQRVFIARALANEPKLLLLDEPTASVDQKIQTGLYELLATLKGKITIVLISHDIGAISSYVDKIACLNTQLFYHDSKEIRKEDLEAAYQCPIELIGHGLPHRVVHKH